MGVKVTKTSNAAQLGAAVAKLAKARVLVGVPQAQSSRKGQGVNNAELLFVHSMGSPLRGIPARPVLQPAIKDKANNDSITRQMRGAAQAAFEGNEKGLQQKLGLAGTTGANAAKGWFTNPKNGWAPNSPATVRRKGSNKPLIDTGQLRRAITYVVDEDGTA